MQNIILISGFGGSGKSTCATQLWSQMDNAAIVEVDHLFRIKPLALETEKGREQIGNLKLQNCLSVTENFIRNEISNVVIDGLVWSQEELDHMHELAKNIKCTVWCFWLKTSVEVRKKRILKRNRDEADSQEFIDLIETNIKDPTPLLLKNGNYYEIDTNTLKIEDVTNEIASILKL